jgi:hypothetical protein
LIATEDPDFFAGLSASTDQYIAGLRDLAADNPGLAKIAEMMAEMIRGQFPGADGQTVIAAAQAANGALLLVEHGGEPTATGMINLIALAGRSLSEDNSR